MIHVIYTLGYSNLIPFPNRSDCSITGVTDKLVTRTMSVTYWFPHYCFIILWSCQCVSRANSEWTNRALHFIWVVDCGKWSERCRRPPIRVNYNKLHVEIVGSLLTVGDVSLNVYLCCFARRQRGQMGRQRSRLVSCISWVYFSHCPQICFLLSGH